MFGLTSSKRMDLRLVRISIRRKRYELLREINNLNLLLFTPDQKGIRESYRSGTKPQEDNRTPTRSQSSPVAINKIAWSSLHSPAFPKNTSRGMRFRYKNTSRDMRL